MPCRVDPSPEEERAERRISSAQAQWNKVFHAHHDEIEAILEKLLASQIDLKTGNALTRRAKRSLADRYEEIFEEINSAESVRKERARILGKWA